MSRSSDDLGSPKRFQTYFELAPDGIMILDDGGRFVEVNEASARYLGHTVDELLKMSVHDVVLPEHLEEPNQALQDLVSTGSIRRTVSLRLRDGRAIWVDLNGAQLAPNRYIAFVRDATERMNALERLQNSDAQLRRLTESMRDFIAELDVEGRFAYVSPSYYTVLNLAPQQLLGQWVIDRVHPDDRAEVLSVFRKASTGVAEVESLFRYLDGFGAWRWLEARGGRLEDASGKRQGFVFSSRDVTDRQLAVEARLHTEGILQAFLESTPDLAFIKDENLNNLYANGAYLKFLGRSLDEVVGRPDSALLDAELAQQCRQSDIRAIDQFMTVVNEEDSGAMVFETTKFPIVLGSGKIGLGGVIRDVTERRRAREQLEHRLQALTEPIGELSDLTFSDLFDLKAAKALMDGVYDVLGVSSLLSDPSGKTLARRVEQPAVCTFLRSADVACGGGCSLERSRPFPAEDDISFRKCSAGRLLHGTTPIAIGGQVLAYWTVGWIADADESDAERMHAALAMGLDERAYWSALKATHSVSHERFAGMLRFVQLLAKQLSQLAHRNLQQALEIHNRQTAEEEHRRLEEQLQHAQKMEAIGRLAGGIAHDFGNLLTTIVGNLALAQMDVPHASPVHEYLGEIQMATQRAETLTRQVLAFSRKQVIDFKILNPNGVITSMSRLLGRLIGEDISLVVETDPDLGAILADPGQLEQVVANLMVNARDAMPKGGRLLLRTANLDFQDAMTVETWSVPPGSYVLLEVVDSGSGMSAEVKKHLFEPFFTTKSREKGTGLGLAMVYSAVVQHKAHVVVDSKVGVGTAVRIYFPRVGEKPQVTPAPVDPKLPEGQETVLLVEDDVSVNKAATRVLRRLGYTVYPETSPVQALAFVRAHEGPLHAIISDVVMPEMSGDELCRQVRHLRPEIKVILTSGYTDNRLTEDLVPGGDTLFVRKPYSFGALAAALRGVLGDCPGKEEPA